MSKKATSGDTVKVHYTGKLEDGTVFDTSKKKAPFEFTLGKTSVIAGFEQAILGMQAGEQKTIKISSDNAYGPHLPELVSTVKKTQFPTHITPKLGQQLEIRQTDGPTILVTITNVTDDEVTLDANHPLAGQDLIFDIELIELS
jgi:FKBP-type peptidyl-prolyl cis-trans isomerase 2